MAKFWRFPKLVGIVPDMSHLVKSIDTMWNGRDELVRVALLAQSFKAASDTYQAVSMRLCSVVEDQK
jgi:hypothetical protein